MTAPPKPIHWFVVPIVVILAGVVAVRAQQIPFVTYIPNGVFFPNPAGASQTYSSMGGMNMKGPFFQSLGSNGRSCATCHQPSDGMSVSAANVELRFLATEGRDPIFRPVDGANCDHTIDVATFAERKSAYSLLRTRGLLRVAVSVPPNADFQVINVDNQYGCNDTNTISMYRRPLPSTNLRFLSAVMFDGRESSPATGTTKITYANYPSSLQQDLAHQTVSATLLHAQGDGTRPTAAEQEEIVKFEMSLSTAQSYVNGVGMLNRDGARGGTEPLTKQPFFISVNSSVHFLLPQFEQPGGLAVESDGQFTSSIFDTFGGWSSLPEHDRRSAIARGQAIFNSKPMNITGVSGLNDDVSAGGLAAGGIPVLKGTCGTCHDTPNVGNHSFATPLNIGTGDPALTESSRNLGGLDISYLPSITVCKIDPATGSTTANCKTTTDLGQALVDGRFDHVGKIKGPVLRGLSARAPYFHNGSAKTLRDAVHFYETRFGLTLTHEEESDLVAFLSAL